MGANDRGTAGSEAGGIRGRETVTAAGEGDTESVDHSREPPSADDIGTDVALFPRRTAPATAATSATAAASATATLPTRLDRCDVFLLWKAGSHTDTLSEL